MADYVTDSMVRQALALCPTDMNQQDRWRWIAKFINKLIAAAPQQTADDIHSCSYYCTRPECIKAQRDELRDRLEAQQQAEPQRSGITAEQMERLKRLLCEHESACMTLSLCKIEDKEMYRQDFDDTRAALHAALDALTKGTP